ncbi:hypothetical protein OROGR_018116 [Orobanche gracilis]
MEAIPLSSIPKLPLIRRSLTKPSSPPSRNRLVTIRKLAVSAKKGESEGKPVDETIIVLKMRIKKMKSIKSSENQDQTRLPSSDVNERETKLFSHRDHDDVFEAINLLQLYFLKTRSGVAILGVLGLMAVGLSLSQPDLLPIVVKVVKELLTGCHVCIDIDV